MYLHRSAAWKPLYICKIMYLQFSAAGKPPLSGKPGGVARLLCGGAQSLLVVGKPKGLAGLGVFTGLKPYAELKPGFIDADECVRRNGLCEVVIGKWVWARFARKADGRLSTQRFRAWLSKEDSHDLEMKSSAALQSVDGIKRENGACVYLKRSIQSGEVIQYPGTVIVLGDVNLGGAVVADNDVVILGQLLGKAHAGREGNRNSTILALKIKPCGLLIIHNIELVPEVSAQSGPEIASLGTDGTIRRKVLQTPGIEDFSKGDMRRSKYAIQPAKTALLTGAYISIVGTAVLLFPQSIFGFFFDLQTISLGWIQVFATLAVFLFASFCWIVIQGAMPLALFFVGAVNLLGALLMLRALQQFKEYESGS
ncbi:hypothetical protein O6H91_15G088800 [Diphasiastrum complanatum]|uniref:Uncharacterized protein n=1 Tax=Diphasiastrum complanatum TaxID=34168 RepID=A0ACC2BKM0_DIPCM|nr:hypothetical protein O6H91_15G088800 [Diphasiastrum complanatum]